MTLDAMTTALKKLITRGKERGYVTLDDLNAALPAEQVSSEMIEDTMAMLGDIGINVVERGDPEDGEAAVAGPRNRLAPCPSGPARKRPWTALGVCAAT
jgi:RNA polymerase primary sigma factor